MSISLIPNQPIYFDAELDPLSCTNIPYIQLIQNTDVTEVQITLGECANFPDEIQNGDMSSSTGWTLGAGWSIAAGVASITVAGGSSSLSQAIFVGSNKRYYLYKITIEVNSIDGDVDFNIAAAYSGALRKGTNTIFFRPSIAAGGVTVTASVGSSIEIESIEVLMIPSEVILSLWDLDGNYIDEIKWDTNPSSSEISEPDPQLTFLWNWTTRANPDDCYYFCLHDPCINTNGQNGLFNGDFDVGNTNVDDMYGFTKTLSAGVTLTGATGNMTFVSPGPIGSSAEALSDFTELKGGITYDLEIKINGSTNTRFTVIVGATASASFSGFGTHNTTITPAADGFVKLRWEDTAGGANQGLDYVRISLNDGNDLVCNHQSNNVKVGTHDCTHVVRLCSPNDGDVLTTDYSQGFNFSDGFSPQLRLVSQIKGRVYGGSRVGQRLSTGVRKMGYSDLEKGQEFKTDNIPWEELDFLQLTTGANNVYIDDSRYWIQTEPDDFEPQEPPQEDKLASVILEIIPYDQEIENKNCKGIEGEC